MNDTPKSECDRTPTKAKCDRTPTPRTDEAWAAWQYAGSGMSVHVGRELERELTAAQEKADGLRSGIDYASDQLSKVTEQRDRLADLVKQFIYILDITEESDGGRLFHPTNITSCRAGDLQKIGELVEALRRASRNQPTRTNYDTRTT